ncbi:hypothetical protein CAEBREN_13067 [Caenorhabditis brenneri]|uniref:Uncharacterized protein n=1 Tax=Caenorhabditis brenneri TaxID=135651 RepID=G0MA19_CAEBE|nr:hypothetical protein CAEBREN_13067 [Caenorhabditis brenneri]
MTWLNEIDPIARKKFMEKYELSYPKFVKKFPKFHSSFWRDIDSIRYYNELLKELNIENRRWITYPNILEKTLLVLILIAMLYNSGPQPNVNAYIFLSVFLFYFIFYFVCVEFLQMIKGNRLPCEFKRFYKELNSFTSMVPSNKEQKLEYQKLKIRILASLDIWQCIIYNVSILVTDDPLILMLNVSLMKK